ncbi:Alpha-2-macroglobulin-like protein 1 [Nymphon striatum]|nr:Alpha-2-macroglobulin-like protein 1 [Nymphon striatum]
MVKAKGGNDTCFFLSIPNVKYAEGRIRVRGQFKDDSYSFESETKVAIATRSVVTFIQTDKAIYKPGQKVQFRILTVNYMLEPAPGVISKVFIQNPNGIRVAQWLNVSNPKGLIQLDMQLSEEPAQGFWKINAQVGGKTKTQLFEVAEYGNLIYMQENISSPQIQFLHYNLFSSTSTAVLPDFSVTITPPKYILGDATTATWKVCSRYSYSKNVQGKMKFEIKYKTTQYDRSIYPTYKVEKKINGCVDVTVNVNSMRWNERRTHYRNLRVNAEVEEDGTGIKYSAEHETKIDSKPLIIEFNSKNDGSYFKPGLPSYVQISIKKPDKIPAGKEILKICYGTSKNANKNLGRSWPAAESVCKNYTSGPDGLINFVVPPQKPGTNYINVDVAATKYPTKYYIDNKYRALVSQPEKKLKLSPWYSPSGSFLDIKPIYKTISCNEKIPLEIHYTTDGGNITLNYQVMSRGRIIAHGIKTRTYVYGEYKGEDSHIKQGDAQMGVVTKPGIYTLPKYIGKFSVSLDATPDMGPVARVLIFYIRPDGETVAAHTVFDIEPCFNNKATLKFKGSSVYPGTKTKYNISAAPNSLCAIAGVDKKVHILRSDNQLTSTKVFGVLKKFDAGRKTNPVLVDNEEYCKKKLAGKNPTKTPPIWRTGFSTVRRPQPIERYYSDYVDALTSFDLMELLCKTEPYPLHVKELTSLFEEEVHIQEHHLDSVSPDQTWVVGQIVSSSFKLESRLCYPRHPIIPIFESAVPFIQPMSGQVLTSNFQIESRLCKIKQRTGYRNRFLAPHLGGRRISRRGRRILRRGRRILRRGRKHQRVKLSKRRPVNNIAAGEISGIPFTRGGVMLAKKGNTVVEDVMNEAEEESGVNDAVEENGVNDAVEIREYFPETWLWDLEVIGEDGTLEKEVEIPHSITEWVGSMFCTSVDKGLGVSPSSSIKAFQPYFASFSLPYSVVQNEKVPIVVSVFNYLSGCISIKLTLEQSDFYDISGDRTRKMCVCSKPGVHSFKISPTGLGEVNLTVYAHAFNDAKQEICGTDKTVSTVDARDTVINPLIVEPEGFPQEVTQSVLFCPSEHLGGFNHTFELSLPDDLMMNSLSTGDIMGPSLSGLEKLVALPTGCGEQNMILFAPNIFVMQYLKGTSSLTSEIEKKSLQYMKLGYQRELNYRHSDGSYSAFGESDKEGSSWLTAFVIKSFAQANEFIEIDPVDLKKSTDWLLSKQQTDGCFPFIGMIHHKDMKGGVGKGVPTALTAYIMISLLESKTPMSQEKIDKAFNCIAKQSDPNSYTLGLTAYAAVLAGKTDLANELLKKLYSRAINEGTSTYWKTASKSVSVELGAYVILTLNKLITAENQAKALNIVRWVARQRNANGGFVSTQDTVIALQAFAEYAIYQSKETQNLKVIAEGGEFTHNYNITKNNRLLMQTDKIETLETKFLNIIEVMATGEGCGLAQATLKYNKINIKPEQALTLSVEGAPHSWDCKKRTIKICASYNIPGENSNMALVTVKMVSGYIPNKESLQKLKSTSSAFKRFEINKNIVNIYFDYLNQTSPCTTFDVVKKINVEDAKPATVTVFDYYVTGKKEYLLCRKCLLIIHAWDFGIAFCHISGLILFHSFGPTLTVYTHLPPTRVQPAGKENDDEVIHAVEDYMVAQDVHDLLQRNCEHPGPPLSVANCKKKKNL